MTHESKTHLPDTRAIGERIGALLDDLESNAPPGVVATAEEAIRLVTQLHGAGLARMIELGGPDLLARMVDDEFLVGLLVLHDLHPEDLVSRVERALREVRPYLGSHGGDVSLVGVDGESGVVRLRMLGSCDGCPSSSVTLKLAVERAILQAAPEITTIEVVDEAGRLLPTGTADFAHDTPADLAGTVTAGGAGPGSGPAVGTVAAAAAGGGVLGVETPVVLGRKPRANGDGWVRLEVPSTLAAAGLVTVDLDGHPVVVCRVAGTLYAYRDGCPGCGAVFGGAGLDGEVLRCPTCGAAYDVRLAGRNLDGQPGHLRPLPLLDSGDGAVKVAVSV